MLYITEFVQLTNSTKSYYSAILLNVSNTATSWIASVITVDYVQHKSLK